MNARLRALIIGALIFLMASLSALHCNAFKIGFDYDIDGGQHIIGAITFALALLLKFPGNKLLSASLVCLLPLLCAVSFSWAELLSEFKPHTSHGWGYLWFIYSYITSFGALVPALLIKWLIQKSMGIAVT